MNSIEFIETTKRLLDSLMPEQRDKLISIITYLNYKKNKERF